MKPKIEVKRLDDSKHGLYVDGKLEVEAFDKKILEEMSKDEYKEK